MSPQADGLGVAALPATVWLLYGSITKLWWTFDDLFHLHFLSMHAPVSYCFSPEVWRLLPFRMFTPLQFLSYQLDLAVLGRNPEGFYTHQLLVFSIAACAVYATLRCWLSPLFAWVAATLFVLGIPSGSWVIELMLRHYIEGLIWAALTTWFFVEALRRKTPAMLIFSSLFYFLAMLDKEIYVPLLAFLLILPEGRLSARLRNLRPHGLALIVYLTWRWVMLGALLGGYGFATRSRELPGLIANLPLKLGGTLVGEPRMLSAFLFSFLLTGIALLIWQRPGSALVAVGAVILILGPIVPVAKSTDGRFGTLPWLLVTTMFVFGCRALAGGLPWGRLAAMALLFSALAVALINNRLDWSHQYSLSERMSAEGRFFLSMRPGDLLRRPQIPAAAMKETRWLKEEYFGLPKGSGWFADDVYLCTEREPRRIWEYDGLRRQVVDVTAAALEAGRRYCSGLRSAPLWATFEFDDGDLSWSFGPYDKGSYSFLFDGGIESFAVQREDSYRRAPTVLSLMVRYESPAGWVTYSPELTMDFQASPRFRWDRRDPGP